MGAPGNPELAVGAVGEDGKLFLNRDLASSVGADAGYIEKEKERQLMEIRSRAGRFRKARARVPLKDKTVIVTDDGVATGATMQAALWAARQENPLKLVAAVPVGVRENIEAVAAFADQVVVQLLPRHLYAIGQYYEDFRQTTDDEVLEILKEYAREKA